MGPYGAGPARARGNGPLEDPTPRAHNAPNRECLLFYESNFPKAGLRASRIMKEVVPIKAQTCSSDHKMVIHIVVPPMPDPTPLHHLLELGGPQVSIVEVQLLLLSFPTKMGSPQVPVMTLF